MVIIYCIEDINDLKYVGKTTQELRERFNQHLSRKYKCKLKYNGLTCKICDRTFL